MSTLGGGTPTSEATAVPRAEGDAAGEPSLREATLSGVRWIVGGRIVAEVLAFAGSVVLARLLTPADFGIAAIALAVQGLAMALTGTGFTSALVQRPAITRRHLEAAAALSLMFGVALAAFVFLAGPLVAPLVGDRAAAAVQLVAPVFIIFGWASPATSVLQRQLDFRRLTQSDVASVPVGVIVSIALAVAGVGFEALILGAVARTLVQAVLLNVAARPPLPRWRGAELRELAAFGVPTALSSVGFLFVRNVDYVIVGAQLGVTQTGLYWRAYQLAFDYQARITVVMQKIAFPVLSRSKDREQLRRMRTRIVRVHCVVLCPMLATFIALAPEMIPWLFGAQWRGTIVPAQILGVAAFAAPLLAGTGALMLALGRPKRLLAANWIGAAGYAIAVFAASFAGLTAVCLAVLAFNIVNVVFNQRFLMSAVAGISAREVATEAAPGLVGALAVAPVCWAAARGLEAIDAPTFVLLLVAAATGALVYLALLRVAFTDAWADLRMLVHRVLQRV